MLLPHDLRRRRAPTVCGVDFRRRVQQTDRVGGVANPSRGG